MKKAFKLAGLIIAINFVENLVHVWLGDALGFGIKTIIISIAFGLIIYGIVTKWR